ncbi:MAG TPA: DNA repair protein RadA [Syntrophobacteraceae bacterium]|nr:DNA repair protein RadA [Syntrophobacteraceae bacterium]
MAEKRIVYRCQQCGYLSPKWLGRCPECQTWDGMVEERSAKGSSRAPATPSVKSRPVPFHEISSQDRARIVTGIHEWDRTLGSGLMPDSMVLLAGDPGIGKSTLLLQALARMARDRQVLYVSGEESPHQLKNRAERLGVRSERLLAYSECSLESVIEVIETLAPEILAVDSIQTLYSEALDVAPGSISQVRECAVRLMRVAKEKGISVILVGHVTKEGAIAGPKALEHLVDTVLYLEGDRTHAFRLLRSVKNRYGSTNEIGVFEMKEEGLEEVPNPSRLLLAERPVGVSGSVVVCSVEGTRPLLVELQALVSATGWVQPRRTTMGVDVNRLSLLVAVLEKKVGLSFAQQDVFMNVAGGIRIIEPAADLAVVTALISSYLDRPVPPDLVVWGEVGLAGEVRGVGHSVPRLAEAHALGFRKHLVPAGNVERLSRELGANCLGVRSLQEVMDALFNSPGR